MHPLIDSLEFKMLYHSNFQKFIFTINKKFIRSPNDEKMRIEIMKPNILFELR